jgi:hypothetical protein
VWLIKNIMALQKREKKLIIGLLVVAIVSSYVLFKEKIFPPEPDITINPVPVVPETAPAVSGGRSRGGGGGSTSGGGNSAEAVVNSEDFQEHNNINDCWVLMDGEVYDITNFVALYYVHTDAVSPLCGTFGFEAGFLSENSGLKATVLSASSKKGIIK